MSPDADLFDQIGRVLEPRPGWHYEPSTTPGAEPSWCLDPGGQIAVAVNVIDGAVCVYLPDEDREIRLNGLDELTEWIDRNEGAFFQP